MKDYQFYVDLGPAYYYKGSFSQRANGIKGAILRNFNGDKNALGTVHRLVAALSRAENDEQFDAVIDRILLWGEANETYIEVVKPGAKVA